jgi:hypothetical protein
MPKRKSLVSRKPDLIPQRFLQVVIKCLAVSVVLLAAKHQGSFMSLAWTQMTVPTDTVSRDKGVAQGAGPSTPAIRF